MKELFSTREAAEFLSCSHHTLNQSRCTGTLLGVESPKHLKIGHAVRYKEEDLHEWINGLTKGGE